MKVQASHQRYCLFIHSNGATAIESMSAFYSKAFEAVLLRIEVQVHVSKWARRATVNILPERGTRWTKAEGYYDNRRVGGRYQY